MGSGQTALVLGGLLLFSFLALTFQNVANQNITTNYENEAIITATSLSQSILETIQLKAFDENTLSSAVQDSSELSPTLGKEAGESSEAAFDDIDDYLNYQGTFSMDRLGDFQVSVNIYYVNQTNPDLALMSPTFSKRIDITISNGYLENPINLYSIVSY